MYLDLALDILFELVSVENKCEHHDWGLFVTTNVLHPQGMKLSSGRLLSTLLLNKQ